MTINAIHSNTQFMAIIPHELKNQTQQVETKITYMEDKADNPQNVALQAAHSHKDLIAAKAEAAEQDVAAAKSAVLENNSNLASVIALSYAYIEKQYIDVMLALAEAKVTNMEKNVAKP